MPTTRSTASTATQSVLLFIVRLVFAGLLLGRAWWRWAIEGIPGQVERLTSAGVPQPELIAWGTILLEWVGGAMLVLGLLTRLIAALVLVENALVIALIKWPNGLYQADGGFEYNVALCALALVFVTVGASHAGIDSLLFRRRRNRAGADDGIDDLYQPKLGSTRI